MDSCVRVSTGLADSIGDVVGKGDDRHRVEAAMRCVEETSEGASTRVQAAAECTLWMIVIML